MVFTAVLAAIAVIAAMVTVPGGKAEAAEPTDFKPNTTLGENTGKAAEDTSWGPLVWAGAPIEGQTGKKYQGHPENNVGWGWCMDASLAIPMNHRDKYVQAEASKLEIPEGYRDAAINVARKLKAATARGDKKAAANYSVYLVALVAHTGTSKAAAAATITGRDPYYSAVLANRKNYPGFTGSAEEFTQLTGYKIVSDYDPPKFEKDPSVTIPTQPQEAFITIVIPTDTLSGPAQPVMPVDQPGLPDDEGETEGPTTSPEVPNTEEQPSDETTSENPEGETSSSETTTESEPSNTEETTPKDSTTEPTSPEETTTEDTGEPTPGKTTDVVPNPDPTPTTEEQEKDLNPEIKTEAKIKDGDRVEKGATVIDTVTYKDLVPGKKYTLKAKLISKKDGETVLGEGSAELVPEESAGEQDVEITVNDKADPAVDAAVAFEKLVSTEVDKDGNETSGSTDENVIATHENINDEKQTVNTKWTPSIKTNADFDNAKQVKAGVTVKDTVTYTDLVPGKEYTLKAELRNKAENDKGEHEVVGKGDVTFTPEKSAGEQVVDIKVNDDVEGVIKAAVAFEDLYSKQVDENGKETPNSDEEKKITDHRDINDQAQTVTSHKNAIVSTNADFENGSKEVVAGAKIVDQVSYEGLVPGKEYSLDAQLISKADGKTVLGETKGHTFKPEAADGTEAVTITVNDDVKEPVEAAVAFETLTSKVVNDKGEDTPDNDKPNEIGEHKDINDDDQTVTSEDEPETSTPETTTSTEEVPGKPGDGGEGETSAPSSSEDSSTSTTSETCESEEPGNSESEQPSESEEPSESESSEPSESESVETTSSEASETSESDEPSDCGSTTPEKPAEPSEPTDPNEPGTPGTPGDNDEKDTPKVSTNADFEGDLREVVAGAKVVDQVSYEGLVPGKQYTLDAQLISKEDGKTVLGETKGHTFVPESANGTEAVTIVVDEKVTEPVEAAVAFETLTSTQVDKHGKDNPTDEDNPNPVGEHKDINDDDQTVTTETPKITTNADFEKGSHEVVAGAKIVDEVTYEGLVPGKQYTLKAELINKKDGKSVLGTGEKTFTPEKPKGMVPVTITVNDDVKEPVQAAVAFEELTSTEVNDKGEETPGTTSEKPNHIAEHKDINDDDQTVISHEVHDQDKPGGSSDGSSNGSSNGSSDGSSNGSSKDNKWWLILIPGIGLGKIIKDHFDHKDHGNHNGGHGDNTGNHDGGNGKHTDGHNGGNGHEVKGQDAPKGGNSDNGHGRGVEVQGQEPEETGNALPSNAERVEIKSVPSGATELEPGMQDYIK